MKGEAPMKRWYKLLTLCLALCLLVPAGRAEESAVSEAYRMMVLSFPALRFY